MYVCVRAQSNITAHLTPSWHLSLTPLLSFFFFFCPPFLFSSPILPPLSPLNPIPPLSLCHSSPCLILAPVLLLPHLCPPFSFLLLLFSRFSGHLSFHYPRHLSPSCLTSAIYPTSTPPCTSHCCLLLSPPSSSSCSSSSSSFTHPVLSITRYTSFLSSARDLTKADERNARHKQFIVPRWKKLYC